MYGLLFELWRALCLPFKVRERLFLKRGVSLIHFDGV